MDRILKAALVRSTFPIALSVSATRRNADVVLRSRFYSSPAACQALTTPKTPKRLSRDDRRAVIECFIAE